jgi:hypothetical protein
VSGGFGGPLTKVLGIAVSFVANIALFLVAFRLMTAPEIETRELKVGVVTAALFWTVLQVVGGIYIGHVLKNLSSSYENFGFVIALLVWLHLGAQLTLYAAELNVVLHRGLYPRSLMGPPSEPADRETLTALAKVEERSDKQTVDVSFDGSDADADVAVADAGDAGALRAPDPPTQPDPPGPPSGNGASAGETAADRRATIRWKSRRGRRPDSARG